MNEIELSAQLGEIIRSLLQEARSGSDIGGHLLVINGKEGTAQLVRGESDATQEDFQMAAQVIRDNKPLVD